MTAAALAPIVPLPLRPRAALKLLENEPLSDFTRAVPFAFAMTGATVGILLAFSACEKRPPPPVTQVTTASGGIFVAQVRWCEVYRVQDAGHILYVVVNTGCSVAQSTGAKGE